MNFIVPKIHFYSIKFHKKNFNFFLFHCRREPKRYSAKKLSSFRESIQWTKRYSIEPSKRKKSAINIKIIIKERANDSWFFYDFFNDFLHFYELNFFAKKIFIYPRCVFAKRDFLVPLKIIDDNDGISNMPFVCIKVLKRNLSAIL